MNDLDAKHGSENELVTELPIMTLENSTTTAQCKILKNFRDILLEFNGTPLDGNDATGVIMKYFNVDERTAFLPDLKEFDVSKEFEATGMAGYDDFYTYTIILHLAESISKGEHYKNTVGTSILEMIEILPIIKHECADLNNARLLFAALCSIQSFWIWSEGERRAKQSIPKSLWQSLHLISKQLGLNPIICLYSCACCNWKLKSNKDIVSPSSLTESSSSSSILNPSDIELRYSITGTETERHFFAVMVAIEASGLRIVKHAINYALSFQDPSSSNLSDDQLFEMLRDVASDVAKIQELTMSCRKVMNPAVFYNELRPFLSGFNNKELFPTGGVALDDCDDLDPKNANISFGGGSSAQSSLIPVIDFMLGVDHKNCDFLMNAREYMPEKHRIFIKTLEQYYPKPNDLIESNAENFPLSAAQFVESRSAMIRFRHAHMGLVHDFISAPSQSSSSKLGTSGTGGSYIDPNTSSSSSSSSESSSGENTLASLLNVTLQNTRLKNVQ